MYWKDGSGAERPRPRGEHTELDPSPLCVCPDSTEPQGNSGLVEEAGAAGRPLTKPPQPFSGTSVRNGSQKTLEWEPRAGAGGLLAPERPSHY